VRQSFQAGGHAREAEGGAERPAHSRRTSAFAQGFLSNALNPKVALFYLTFLPQFIRPDEPVLLKSLLLAGIHVVMGLLWLTFYAYALERLALALQRARCWIERLTGAALVALGVRLGFATQT
jgi:threonine/homoserine/homoserine lactone efflux protein